MKNAFSGSMFCRLKRAVRVLMVCAVLLSCLLKAPAALYAAQTEETAAVQAETSQRIHLAGQRGIKALAEALSGQRDQCAQFIREEEEKAYLAAHPGIGRTVALDPGHSAVVAGGTVSLGPGSGERKAADTSGTRGRASGTTEYALTMDICLLVRDLLEEEGYTVLLTRENNDVPVDCVARAAVANDADADIFVRIHANGSVNSGANGAMTICVTPSNPYAADQYAASRRLSDILLDTYCKETGIRKEYVWETDSMTGNNWSEVPCSLLEMGYMTNAEEDLKMADPDFRKVMAAAIVHGIDKYFEQEND